MTWYGVEGLSLMDILIAYPSWLEKKERGRSTELRGDTARGWPQADLPVSCSVRRVPLDSEPAGINRWGTCVFLPHNYSCPFWTAGILDPYFTLDLTFFLNLLPSLNADNHSFCLLISACQHYHCCELWSEKRLCPWGEFNLFAFSVLFIDQHYKYL